MSFRNLIPYLKSKQNEIVDCNIQNEELYFMRLYNVPTNTFFILDVHEQNIPVNSSVLELFPVSRLRKLNEFEEDYTEDLILFFQSIETHFPSSKTILIEEENVKAQMIELSHLFRNTSQIQSLLYDHDTLFVNIQNNIEYMDKGAKDNGMQDWNLMKSIMDRKFSEKSPVEY